jgi:hypothetical protein
MTEPTTRLLATAVPALEASGGDGWWRAILGTVVVFALLILCLRLLRRWPGAGGHASARVEAVWPLGPRREIHIVRLGDQVHYVYRNEQGLVLLREEPWETYRAAGHDRLRPEGGFPRSLRDLWRRVEATRHAPGPARSPGSERA